MFAQIIDLHCVLCVYGTSYIVHILLRPANNQTTDGQRDVAACDFLKSSFAVIALIDSHFPFTVVRQAFADSTCERHVAFGSGIFENEIDKPQLQEEKSRRNGDTHHISELQQRLADCTSLDFDLSNSISQCERSTYIQSAKKYWRISLPLSPAVGSRLVV
ncbi:hypothetical protein T12_7976 [Trichinella patagoniensis]|uniref:Uncharacterized protein n=1 Tax=Trichinella patagoniensis TaxID=990121 RepID=A0A0V1A0V7_9BILA|nr:hypothetical protein T12_7976 [Trichinella patagoniensis]